MKGVKVGGNNYNNLRYADGAALLAGNEKELSELTSTINEVGKQFEMNINIKKTKAMVVTQIHPKYTLSLMDNTLNK